MVLLCVGFKQLIQLAKTKNTESNATIICVHIVAYVLVILAEYSFLIDAKSYKSYEISAVCTLLTQLFSTLMLAFVVYKLSQKSDKLVWFDVD